MRSLKITNPIFITPVSIPIICALVFIGCTPFGGYVALDAESGLLQPTFRMYADQHFQERVGRITSITVSKSGFFSEEQKHSELDSPWDGSQTVWDLDYKPADKFIGLLRVWFIEPPLSRLTYGKVPPSYEEKVEALPLEPGQSYFVDIWGLRGIATFHGTLEFSICLDDTGRPDRIEYSSPDDIFEWTRDALRLNPRTRE